MNSPLIQLLVLAGIAIFLIIKLRSVLGTREGFEKPPVRADQAAVQKRADFEVIEGGPDRDIVDYVPESSPTAKALAEMKKQDPEFTVGDFIGGARGAYEMILMAFGKGDISDVRPFLAADVDEALSSVIAERNAQGLTIDAEFLGVSEVAIQHAEYDPTTKEAEITMRMTGEFTYTVRNAEGEIVEGGDKTPKRQRDIWTFARRMTENDPNWTLVATDE